MSEPTPKEAIANLNHIYGIFAPDIQRSLDVAIKALERPKGEWIFDSEFTEFGNPYGTYRCSICGGHSSDEYSFCKDCGADMRGGKECFQTMQK